MKHKMEIVLYILAIMGIVGLMMIVRWTVGTGMGWW